MDKHALKLPPYPPTDVDFFYAAGAEDEAKLTDRDAKGPRK